MNILHFILGRASPNTSNGVNKVIAGHAKYLRKLGHSVHVIGLSSSQVEPIQVVERDGFEVEAYSSFYFGVFKRLRELVAECDVVHLHSVWNNYNLIVAGYLRRIGKPYIVTAHSGLTEDRLRQSRYLFKKYYHICFQKKMFDGASGVQALTREEATVLSQHTTNKNIFFVQNGQDLEGENLNNKIYPDSNEKIKLGFLGRLTVEKNVNGLIDSIALLPESVKSMVEVHLIGSNKTEQAILQEQVVKLRLENHIIFRGALYGAEKDKALSDLDIYVHPAHSDVVSIAVMEAMKAGLPSVITRTSDVSYFYNSGAFVMVEPMASDISRGIVEIINKREQWPAMSQSAIELVKSTFNWDVAVRQLSIEYSKCL